VLAAARADYEAHTGSFAGDHHALAYLRGLLGDRSGVPGDEPLRTELLNRALRAELKSRLGRGPSKEQIQSLLKDILAGKDEAGAARLAALSLQSMPAEAVGALRQLAHSTKRAPAARDLLKLGRRLVRDAAASAGISLAQVDTASSQAKPAASAGVRRSFRKAEVQPAFQREFSAEARVLEEMTRQKRLAPVGTPRERLQLTEELPREYRAGTVIAAMCRSRLARRAFAAKRAAKNRASAGAPVPAAGTLPPPAESEPAQERAPLPSATWLAVAQALRQPPPPSPSDKVRAIPRLPSVHDLTDGGGAAAAEERNTPAALSMPKPPPRQAMPAKVTDGLARVRAARAALWSPRGVSRSAVLAQQQAEDAGLADRPPPGPAPPAEASDSLARARATRSAFWSPRGGAQSAAALAQQQAANAGLVDKPPGLALPAEAKDGLARARAIRSALWTPRGVSQSAAITQQEEKQAGRAERSSGQG
jgi:hypothetical protein